jgi:putative protein-disulfide isomerase
MILAIQQAYYLQAQNPSDDCTLNALASHIGLNTTKFETQLNHPNTQKQLNQEIAFNQSIQAISFPSLVLEYEGVFNAIPIDYTHADAMLQSILKVPNLPAG